MTDSCVGRINTNGAGPRLSLAPAAKAQVGEEGAAGSDGLRRGRVPAIGPDVLRQIWSRPEVTTRSAHSQR